MKITISEEPLPQKVLQLLWEELGQENAVRYAFTLFEAQRRLPASTMPTPSQALGNAVRLTRQKFNIPGG